MLRGFLPVKRDAIVDDYNTTNSQHRQATTDKFERAGSGSTVESELSAVSHRGSVQYFVPMLKHDTNMKSTNPCNFPKNKRGKTMVDEISDIQDFLDTEHGAVPSNSHHGWGLFGDMLKKSMTVQKVVQSEYMLKKSR